MIRLRLTFSAGQYHATPWGRHVNEGISEWPPSPYRLLRALYDVWQRKCFDLSEGDVRAILEGLAEHPPEFALPKATATHTRSYLSANSPDPTDKSLVFDGFLAFGDRRTCWITWPDLHLNEAQQAVLDRLVREMSYLGRSESWVDAELTDESPEDTTVPCVSVHATSKGVGELTRVACVTPASEYRGKTPWLIALTYSTANLLKDKASAPPLLRQVGYARAQDAIETDPPRRVASKAGEIGEIMLGLDATVLPLATETLFLAEQIRTRLMGAHKKIVGADNVSPLFSGKGADGQKRLDHGHLYIFPLSNRSGRTDKDGRIDRVLLRSTKANFSRDELDAVRWVTRLWQSGGKGDVRCVVTGQARLGGYSERACKVESSTPFIAPRYWRKGRDYKEFLLNEIRRECANHGVDGEVINVEWIEKLPGRFHQLEYWTTRRGDPPRPTYAVEITFDRKVAVPFAIGYGAHFGLGQFQAK